MQEGRDGLIHAGTGNGKTYAAWFSFVNGYLNGSIAPENELQVLWITPIRALVNDIETALRRPVEEMNLPFPLHREPAIPVPMRNKSKNSSCRCAW